MKEKEERKSEKEWKNEANIKIIYTKKNSVRGSYSFKHVTQKLKLVTQMLHL